MKAMKLNPSLLLVALLFAVIAAARAEWHVWTLTETRHVLRSEPPANSAAVKLGAARNEWVSFQILLRSDAPVKALRVEAGDLKGSSGVRCVALTPGSTASTSFTSPWALTEMTASNQTGIPTRSSRSCIR